MKEPSRQPNTPLAINPESMMGLRIKGASLYRLERDPETVTAIYRRIVASAEAEDTDVSTLAAALMETNRQAEAVEMLTGYIGQHLDSRLAIDVLLVLDREKAAPYVRSLIASDLLSEKRHRRVGPQPRGPRPVRIRRHRLPHL